jgi:RHS repeat-associated protein
VIWRDGQLLAQVEANGTVRHFHLDHLGTPRAITGSGGALISQRSYFGFGREATSTAQADGVSLKFTAHQRDQFTGGNTTDYLDYMHARSYDPNLGRFLSVDPVLDTQKALKEPQRWNRYSYVMNNPLRFTDPDGRDLQPFDYVEAVWDATKTTADQIGFAIAYPGLKLMQGFINDDPRAVAEGSAMIAGEAALGAGLNALTMKTLGWTSKANLLAHAEKHAANMGFRTFAQYEVAAFRFVGTAGKEGVQTIALKTGERFVYNAATKEFAMLNKAGKIIDYRHANLKYWIRQLNKYKDQIEMTQAVAR